MPVEEAARLMTVQGIIGRFQIQHDRFRRLRVQFQQQVDEKYG
jgi:hypothetical protein